MPDRENVIKGLEAISDYFFDIYRNDTDSYKCAKAQEYSDCAIDALALLKEQDAVKPKLSMSGLWYECPVCHRHLIKDRDNYCARCGRRVKWE